MQTQSSVQFPGASRMHVALEVRDLDESLVFYRTLFQREPAKVRPDYAKFEPDNPSVNLSLNLIPANAQRPARVGDQHFGIQVKSTADVEAAVQRLRAAGLETRVEKAEACCYAVQDKVWVDDPDGNAWEIFVVLGDAAEHGSKPAEAEAGCCVPSPFTDGSGAAGTGCC